MTEATTDALISTGGLAARLGVSISSVKSWSKTGRIPAPITIEGSGRKVWPVAEIPAIEARVTAQRGSVRRQGDRVTVAG